MTQTKISKAYGNPEYYEIALSSLRNIKKEVDFLDQCAKKYSKIKVKNMMEIGCGNSPYMEQISNKGYEFIGLDLNKEMLIYTKEKANKKGIKIKTIHADMLNFKSKEKIDFCFVLFGSIYRRTNDDFLKHLKCISNSMKKGGLYIMHMVVEGDPADTEGKFWDYSHKDKIKIKVLYSRKILNYFKQIRQENLTLFVNDDGKKFKLFEPNIEKIIYPQEFKLLIEKSDFEFVDWFDGFNLNKKFDDVKKSEFVVSVIRKK